MKLFCPDFQLCGIAVLTDSHVSGEERVVLGLSLLLPPDWLLLLFEEQKMLMGKMWELGGSASARSLDLCAGSGPLHPAAMQE